MMHRRALLALALVVSAGCAAEEVAPPDVVARYGGEDVHYQEFAEYLRRGSLEDAGLSDRALTAVFDEYLAEALLARIVGEEENSPVMERDEALHAIASRIESEGVDPAAIEARYREQSERFRRSERIRLRQILVAEREAAEAAVAALDAGEPFREVAARLSLDPAGARSGAELGVDDLPPALAETILALSPGERSGIVEADYGFHLFLLEERSPERVLSLAEATPILREELLRERADAEVGRLVEAAAERYNVRVFSRNLPFIYTGRYPHPEETVAPEDTPS